ncbi:uncharacterized protein [Bemisia tabaci]|uniref:uncharacterized protein n=1 Tax=Bemisia tabaci TaxID=7038 RepID=UPI003B283A04
MYFVTLTEMISQSACEERVIEFSFVVCSVRYFNNSFHQTFLRMKTVTRSIEPPCPLLIFCLPKAHTKRSELENTLHEDIASTCDTFVIFGRRMSFWKSFCPTYCIPFSSSNL